LPVSRTTRTAQVASTLVRNGPLVLAIIVRRCAHPTPETDVSWVQRWPTSQWETNLHGPLAVLPQNSAIRLLSPLSPPDDRAKNPTFTSLKVAQWSLHVRGRRFWTRFYPFAHQLHGDYPRRRFCAEAVTISLQTVTDGTHSDSGFEPDPPPSWRRDVNAPPRRAGRVLAYTPSPTNQEAHPLRILKAAASCQAASNSCHE
jgi:hypothetical protein